MALNTKATFRRGWRRLREGMALAGHVRARIDFVGAAKVARRGIADLLFPPSCAQCAAELDQLTEAGHDARLCDACLEEMEIFSEPMCVRCGAPLPAVLFHHPDVVPSPPTPAGCYHCSGPKLWFVETIALGAYEGLLRETVLRMKNATGDSLTLAMGRLLVKLRAGRLATLNAGVVAPIPSHWRRRFVHRTNSAALLAEVLAGGLRVPLAERLVKRSRYTLRQSDLGSTERWNNVRRAFRCEPVIIYEMLMYCW